MRRIAQEDSRTALTAWIGGVGVFAAGSASLVSFILKCKCDPDA